LRQGAFARTILSPDLMKILIDTEAQTLVCNYPEGERTLPLYSDDAFDLLSHHWIKIGWNQKYPYTFSWLGRPIIQLPEDVLRIQEVLWQVKPDVIIETGVAHGGSLVFYASLCEAIGRGRVIGIDIEIRPANRKAIEAHPLAKRITLIEGSSTAPEIVARARGLVKAGETCLVILDSNHTKAHVRAELDAYHALVTPGSYLIATDGVMQDLHDVPRGQNGWRTDNPATAAREFAATHPEFVLGQPPWQFNESTLRHNLTHWPDAYLRRR
jgi:cephalosporin hydroxylase